MILSTQNDKMSLIFYTMNFLDIVLSIVLLIVSARNLQDF